jgi:hypothetical protein
MLHIYAMCGVAFSGKSTLALRIAAELSICLISLDTINHKRGLRGGEGPSFITRRVGRRRCSDGEFVTHDPQKTRATYCTISSFVGQPHALSKCLGNRARHKSHALQGAKPLACNRKRWEPRSALSPVDFPHYSARSQVTVTTISWPSRTARDRFTLYGGRIRSRHTR